MEAVLEKLPVGKLSGTRSFASDLPRRTFEAWQWPNPWSLAWMPNVWSYDCMDRKFAVSKEAELKASEFILPFTPPKAPMWLKDMGKASTLSTSPWSTLPRTELGDQKIFSVPCYIMLYHVSKLCYIMLCSCQWEPLFQGFMLRPISGQSVQSAGHWGDLWAHWSSICRLLSLRPFPIIPSWSSSSATKLKSCREPMGQTGLDVRPCSFGLDTT